MEILGLLFLVLIALAVLFAIGFTLVELPSINRYRRIRRM